MAYKQVSYGSSGSDVRELQKKLNEIRENKLQIQLKA